MIRTKWIKLCDFAFMISSISILSIRAAIFWIECYFGMNQLYYILVQCWYFAFLVQAETLCIIFLFKVKVIFEPTMFRINDCILIGYKFIFIFVGIIWLPLVIFYSYFPVLIWQIIIISYLCIFVLGNISLVCLFIFKLIQVYKMEMSNSEDNDIRKDSDTQVLDVIKKTTILITFSLFITLCHIFMIVFFYNYQFIVSYFGLFDSYTNWIFITLSYGEFNDEYKCICNCIHSKCDSFWGLCIYNDDNNKQDHEKHDQLELSVGIQTNSFPSKKIDN